MPPGSKKRRAARKKKELEKNLALESVENTQDVISISASSNADEEDGSISGNVGTVSVSNPEVESEKEPFTMDDKGIDVDSGAEKSKENEKTSKSEPSLSAKDDSTMSPSQEKRMLLVKDVHMYKTKKKDSKPKTDVESTEDAPAHAYVKLTRENTDESAKGSNVFVSPSHDESSKKSINDTAKMTENAADSDLNGTDVNALPSKGEKTELLNSNSTIPAEPAHDDLKMSEDNVLAPPGAHETSESATSILSDRKANEEISPSHETNFLESIDGSYFIKNDDEHNLEFKGSDTKEDDLGFLDGNNPMLDTPPADESDSKDSSAAILVEDGSGFIPKQDDDAYPSAVVHGVDAADKENEFHIQIQNDKGSFSPQRDSSPSFGQEMLEGDDQKEALQQAMKSAISNDELNKIISLLSSSGYILCDLVGGNVIRDGKILSTNVQINQVKKMLEEELLATEKLGASLKKVLRDLEAVQINSDLGLSA